jgi:hypothetical protein
MEAKADANLREMMVEIRSNQGRKEAKTEASDEKFQALQGTLVSCLPDGYPPRQDRGHSRRNESQGEQKSRKVG